MPFFTSTHILTDYNELSQYLHSPHPKQHAHVIAYVLE
jgi:hypothetical protein